MWELFFYVSLHDAERDITEEHRADEECGLKNMIENIGLGKGGAKLIDQVGKGVDELRDELVKEKQKRCKCGGKGAAVAAGEEGELARGELFAAKEGKVGDKENCEKEKEKALSCERAFMWLFLAVA